ncbi:MAG: beta-N-acetylhexosaminidase [Anaerolineae bacterium]|nr:beta-N-acetylhexosaminidase [Anaerolineae bacterium]
MFSLEEKVGQMMMVGFPQLEPPDYLLDWLREGRVGGVILFARNVASPHQLADLTAALHAAARSPILISIDQEGGTVARLREGFTESPGAMALGAADSEALAEELAYMMGVEMRALGINWNLAPVVDVTHDINNPTVGTRSPGSDAALISRLAAAQVRGFQAAGVAACPKHFPGLGNTPVDTHHAQAIITGSLDYLWEHDLVPFRAAIQAGAAAVMISHVTFEALDPQHPATLSRSVITTLLRQEIGFSGMTSTDCMEMKAVAAHYRPGESAVIAALAGEDVILFSHTRAMQEEAYEALLAAAQSGRVPLSRIDEAVSHITALKARFAITEAPHPDLIRHPDHLALAEKAARAGIVMLKNDPSLLPVNPHQKVIVVEFYSYLESEAMERAEQSNFGKLLRKTFPALPHIALSPTQPDTAAIDQAQIQAADVLILATRSAHLNPAQQAAAAAMLKAARKSILLCLRNPYDVDVLPPADVILCACGDSTPSLQAVLDVLAGQFTPTGKLPVPVNLKGS